MFLNFTFYRETEVLACCSITVMANPFCRLEFISSGTLSAIMNYTSLQRIINNEVMVNGMEKVLVVNSHSQQLLII